MCDELGLELKLVGILNFTLYFVCVEDGCEYKNKITMGGNNCMCSWNRSANGDHRLINFKYFWSKVCYDECGSRPPRIELSKQIRKMYFAKNLILSTKENNYIFTIGIVPTEKFDVLMRLELEDTGVYIEMRIPEIQQLFAMLHQTFHTNITHPSVLAATTTTSIPTVNMSSINVKLFHHNIYKLCVRDKQILITYDGLLTLMESENCIKFLMKNYEIKAKLCGNTVFKLLNLCCRRLRNINEPKKYFTSDFMNENGVDDAVILKYNNGDLENKINLSEILDELMCSPCDCLSTTFIIETKIHFYNLISLWIGIYYETQLLSEAVRVNTFKKKWPHKFIDVVTLAKNGFFYVGPIDRVQCIFCKTVLDKWQPSDTVVGEHKRFAPFCSSSLDKATNNIPVESFVEFETLW